jgi:hypothetical protein
VSATPVRLFRVILRFDTEAVSRALDDLMAAALTAHAGLDATTAPIVDGAAIQREVAALLADHRVRFMGLDPAGSRDESGVRFSQINAEAEREMAEWDAILRGTVLGASG